MASACVNNNVSVSQEFPSYGCFNPRGSFNSRENGPGSTVSEIQKKHIPATEIMESVCVNNDVSVSQEFSCFNPRSSFSREDVNRSSGSNSSEIQKKKTPAEESGGDFEFSLVDPVGMLPADELFSDGKLVTTKQQSTTETVEIDGKCRKIETETEISGDGLFSPKAPRCSSRWRELLGLKRFNKSTTNPNPRSSSSSSSIKQFLNRNSRSSSSSSSSSSSEASLLSLPLLKDSDYESLSLTSSRMSLSSSSSSHDHEDLPRLSLDANLTTANPFAPSRSQNPPPRMRLLNNPRTGRSEERSQMMNRGVSVDSPRLNSSGKIVFQSLERSSSSPSSFNGGTSGYRHRGMERSYSSNVRVTPVLNVPVCSIRGGSVIFGQFFSPSSSSSTNPSSQHNRTGSRASIINRGRNSTDRI